jgi:chromosome segregation ATPase
LSEQKGKINEQKFQTFENKLALSEQKFQTVENKLALSEQKFQTVENKLALSEQKGEINEQKFQTFENKLALSEQKGEVLERELRLARDQILEQKPTLSSVKQDLSNLLQQTQQMQNDVKGKANANQMREMRQNFKKVTDALQEMGITVGATQIQISLAMPENPQDYMRSLVKLNNDINTLKNIIDDNFVDVRQTVDDRLNNLEQRQEDVELAQSTNRTRIRPPKNPFAREMQRNVQDFQNTMKVVGNTFQQIGQIFKR